MHAAGIKKAAGSRMAGDAGKRFIVTSEPMKAAGELWCAIVMNPALVTDVTEADGNYVMAAKVPPGGPAVYYAGFAWDKAGHFAGLGGWSDHVKEFGERLRSPVAVTLSAR